MSYNGRVRVTVNVDPAIVSREDSNNLAHLIELEFDKLHALTI
jgi:hypothetical protein